MQNVRVDRGRIILETMIVRPAETSSLSAIRKAVADCGIQEADEPELVAEARHEGRY